MIRVLIVDDTRLHREGLARVLGQASCIDVVGTAASCVESLAYIPAQRPEIVLLHVSVPAGIAAMRMILDRAPDVRVVAFGVAETEEEIVACAEAGAAGYVMREGSLSDLIAVVEGVMRGDLLCSPRIAGTLLRRVASLAAQRRPQILEIHLTPQETKVVELIDEGLSNKEIASRLQVEVRTVKSHVHNILEKLHVHRRWDIAARIRTTRGLGNDLVQPVNVPRI